MPRSRTALPAEAARLLLAAPADEVAPLLLGARVCVRTEDPQLGQISPEVSVVITEVEAYLGRDDPAAHSFRGPTPRTQVMFGEPGHLYCYFSYGMHHCCNIVTGPSGSGEAVLLRAGRVESGVELAARRRTRPGGQAPPVDALARGPACLAQALGLDLRHNDLDLLDPTTRVRLTIPDHVRPRATDVRTGPRVGISQNADAPLRFWLAGEPVSAYRRSPRARPPQP